MSWLMTEYACPCGRVRESLEPRGSVATALLCECGDWATRCISAVKCGTVYATVSQGKSDPPPNPIVTDTRAIADHTLSQGQWRQRRAAEARDRRRAWYRNTVS